MWAIKTNVNVLLLVWKCVTFHVSQQSLELNETANKLKLNTGSNNHRFGVYICTSWCVKNKVKKKNTLSLILRFFG